MGATPAQAAKLSTASAAPTAAAAAAMAAPGAMAAGMGGAAAASAGAAPVTAKQAAAIQRQLSTARSPQEAARIASSLGLSPAQAEQMAQQAGVAMPPGSVAAATSAVTGGSARGGGGRAAGGGGGGAAQRAQVQPTGIPGHRLEALQEKMSGASPEQLAAAALAQGASPEQASIIYLYLLKNQLDTRTYMLYHLCRSPFSCTRWERTRRRWARCCNRFRSTSARMVSYDGILYVA